jgi:hypothetical protein
VLPLIKLELILTKQNAKTGGRINYWKKIAGLAT